MLLGAPSYPQPMPLPSSWSSGPGRSGLKGNLKPLLELESGSNDPHCDISHSDSDIISGRGRFHRPSISFPPSPSKMALGAVLGLSGRQGSCQGHQSGKAGIRRSLSCFDHIPYPADIRTGHGPWRKRLFGGLHGGHKALTSCISKCCASRLAWHGDADCHVPYLGLLVFPRQLFHIIGDGLFLSFILMFVARLRSASLFA